MSNAADLHCDRTILPDLLSSEELSAFITQYLPNLKNVKKMSHSRLVEVYQEMFLPLPQREYSSNRRGQLLLGKRKKSGLQADPVQPLSLCFDNVSLSSPTAAKRPKTDRLKPPPDLEKTKTKIQIPSARTDHKADHDRIVINKRTASTFETDAKIVSNVDAKKEKIVLKRPDHSSRERTSSEGSEGSTDKAKRVKITWP